MTPLRILVAVDHDLLRRGIKSLLEDQRGWEVCGEARTGIEAVSRAEQLQPDVAILDITMPQLNGLDATRKIRKASWQTEILLLSVQYSDRLVQDSFEAGALGYLLKSDSGQHLVKAVETLALHRPFYTARAKEALLAQFNSAPATDLTPREREILQLISEGKATREIAALLSLSVKTIEFHRSNIMRKLNAHKVSELVRYAVRNRIIEP
jgi:DNA-binding NarL/FixJ family response regulator